MQEPLTERILKFFDGQLSEDEERALATEIRGDRAAEQLLARHMRMQGNLPTALAEVEGGAAAAVPLARGRVIRAWPVAAAAALLLAAGIWFYQRVDMVPAPLVVATASRVEGTVTLARGDVRQAVTAGTAVQAGDSLVVAGAVAFVRLEYSDGTLVELGGESAAVFAPLQTPDLAAAATHHVQLERGRAGIRVTPVRDGPPRVFSTSHSIVEVVGTRFTLVAEPDLTRVEMEEGAIRLTCRRDLSQKVVRGGQHAVVNGDMGISVANVEEYLPTTLRITNLRVASGRTYDVVYGGLYDGARRFSDREVWRWERVPPELEGATFIRPANDDKDAQGDSFLSFDVNEDVVVYISIDARRTSRPPWLRAFAPMPDPAYANKWFLREYPAGSTVVLGGNGISEGYSTYVVVIVPVADLEQ